MKPDFNCYTQTDQQAAMRRRLERDRITDELAIARERVQWDAMLRAERLSAEYRRVTQ